MTVQEKRKKLNAFCDTQDNCGDCVLKSPVCRCGCGVHFLHRGNDGQFQMTDEEINAAFAVAFPEPETPHIKDSGSRSEFSTGAVRDIQEGKGRCDLLPLDVVADCYSRAFPGEGIDTVFASFHRFTQTGDIQHLYDALSVNQPFDGWADLFLEVSMHFEEGAKKYGEYNWQKGLPLYCYINSAVRHYLKWLRGDDDEPHDRAFCWNIICAIWTCEHKPELNNYGKEKNHAED